MPETTPQGTVNLKSLGRDGSKITGKIRYLAQKRNFDTLRQRLEALDNESLLDVQRNATQWLTQRLLDQDSLNFLLEQITLRLRLLGLIQEEPRHKKKNTEQPITVTPQRPATPPQSPTPAPRGPATGATTPRPTTTPPLVAASTQRPATSPQSSTPTPRGPATGATPRPTTTPPLVAASTQRPATSPQSSTPTPRGPATGATPRPTTTPPP